MRRRLFITVLCIFGILFLTNGCLDPYNPPESRINVRYLVVDCFLNGTDQTCTITLSRTITLDSKKAPPLERGAKVTLEDENGNSINLPETQPGVYKGSNLPFSGNSRVKLKITTREAKGYIDYESDPVTLLQTPPIDSVSYGAERTGVPIYVSTHDPTGNTNYYQWRVSETWSYTAAYQTALTVSGLNIVYSTEDNFQCWKTEVYSSILVGSSSPLETEINKVTKQLLITIPWESAKLSQRYSVLVGQRAISKEAYEYLQELKKNTENLGTLFDPLPSQPIGNIRCITDSEQLALGYFTASTTQQQRIFFDALDLDRPVGTMSLTGYENCLLTTIMFASQWESYRPVGGTLPLRPYVGTEPPCVDCRMKGGTTTMPAFWTFQ